jgi:hypothetical protein
MESSVQEREREQVYPALFHASIPDLEVELELVYELYEDDDVPATAPAVDDEADHAEIQLVSEDADIADTWFAQPEDVIALTDDYMTMQTPANWLLRGLFLAGVALTVVACIGVTTI